MVYDLGLSAWRKPESVAGSAAPAIMIGCFVAFGGILFGYDTGTISGIIVMPWWLKQFSTGHKNWNPATEKFDIPGISPAESAEIVSILSAGTFFGALFAAPMADKLGRRKALMAAIVVFTVGVILQTASMRIPLFVAGRFIAGMGVGTISVLVPLYQSEMAPKWIRGALVCAYQLAITVGLFTASIVNNFTAKIDSAACFRISVAIQFIWASILFLGLCVLPETPRYLIKRGRHALAAESLSRIRRLDITHPALIEEIAEIEANHAYELSLGPSTYRDVFLGSPHLGRRLLTGCGLQMLQQLSGCNFVFYYGVQFFKDAGIKDPFVYSLVTNIVNVVMTLPGMALVESWGRRRLLLVGAAGMAVCQLIVAIVGTSLPVTHGNPTSTTTPTMGTSQGVTHGDEIWNKVLITFVCCYIAFFAMSWGPVAWVVTSEIYPLKVRAKSMSLSTASNWLLNWAIAYSTPYMVGQGPGYANLESKIFFVWGSCCVLAFVFVWLMVYETSKISLEQIDELYERVGHAWDSGRFQPSWSFQDIQDNDTAQATGNSITTEEREEARRRATTTQQQGATGHIDEPDSIQPITTGSSHATTGSSHATTDTMGPKSMTEEEKIIASLGRVNFTM